MSSGAIYPPTYPTWDDSPSYARVDRRPDYTPHPSSRPLPQYPQHEQPYQTWEASARPSFGSYQGTPYLRPSHLSTIAGSPPPLRPSLGDDPAFAVDPNFNPEHWYRSDALASTPFPARSNPSLDAPRALAPRSSPPSNTSSRVPSYREDVTEPPSAPQGIYFVPPSVASSSSASDSSSHPSSARSSILRNSARDSDNIYEHSDPSLYYVPDMEAASATFEDRQPPPRHAKLRRRHHSAHATPVDGHGDVLNAVIPPAEHPAEHAEEVPHAVTSSIPPSVTSERPKESRRRSSSRPTPPDLDSIDELDESNPYGINLHHKGPYEAVSAILNENNLVDSPLLRVRGIQQQVSAAASHRPSRRMQSVPTANPMSLNLQPGQILQSSIYQPIRAPPFPLERAPATYPPDRYTRSTRMPPSRPTADYDPTDSGSPPRRNQTLSALNPAREPPEQSYHAPPPARPEAHAYQHRSHPAGSDIYQPQPPLRPSTDSQHNIAPPRPDQRRMSQMSRYPQEAPSHSVSVNSAPAQPSEPSRMPTRHSPRVDTFYDTGVSSQPVIVAPPAPLEPPPTPDIDQRLSRTLYLTNPDVPRPDTPEYFSHVPPVIPTSGRMRASRDQRHPPQTQVDSFYGVQPQPQPLSAPPAAQEGRRHSPPRASPPAASTPPRQGSPRRYEPPSQTLATINGQRSAGPPSVMSAPSSTLTTSSLAPRHIPKRLVMPTPLAATAENTPPHVPSPPPTRRAGPSPVPPPAPAPARANAGDPRRPGHLLRKRSAPGGMQAPRRIPEPPRTETRGVLAFFGFGKSSKAPVVRQVRVAEPPAPPRREMRERQQQQQQQQQQRVRAPAEVRKLSKRK